MANSVTLYIDKNDYGLISLHQHDRTMANRLAVGFSDTIGKMTAVIANQIEWMQNYETLEITIKKVK